MNAIVQRATVETIVAHRNKALAMYEQAYDAMVIAQEARAAAANEVRQVCPVKNSYNYHLSQEKRDHLGKIEVPEKDKFLTAARETIDIDVWAHIIQITDVERYMDAKAKQDFRQSLLTDPPEATVENIFATVENFILQADDIFKRGIALCFSSLDRRFKSHDGWKIGDRVIIGRVLDENGWWNHHWNMGDRIADVERIFYVLDGKPVPSNYSNLEQKIRNDRDEYRKENKVGFGQTFQSVHETDYFRVRLFQNGNAHLWFLRDDLVEQVNKLLGEYYGAPIPQEREATGDDPLSNPKTAIAKNFAFFPTPDAVAVDLIERSEIHRTQGLEILEPSAGTGNLARRIADRGHRVDCVELHHGRAKSLSGSGLYKKVFAVDFLLLEPARLYDRIIMNPPFDRERDIDHVVHALKFLKPNGLLTAIMSAGTEWRNTKKSTAFRKLVESKNGKFYDLPAGSFSSVGTNCNTVILKVWNDGRTFY